MTVRSVYPSINWMWQGWAALHSLRAVWPNATLKNRSVVHSCVQALHQQSIMCWINLRWHWKFKVLPTVALVGDPRTKLNMPPFCAPCRAQRGDEVEVLLRGRGVVLAMRVVMGVGAVRENTFQLGWKDGVRLVPSTLRPNLLKRSCCGADLSQVVSSVFASPPWAKQTFTSYGLNTHQVL